MKWIIDCDAGVDDAQALLLAAALVKCEEAELEIVGVTCCAGNVGLDSVMKNVNHVLSAAKLTDVPVFRGADAPLLASAGVKDASHYHGNDGLAGFWQTSHALKSASLTAADSSSKSAAIALVELITLHSGDVALLALAPLTNIALAVRLAPDLGKHLSLAVVMGGAMLSKGNLASALSVEFNFGYDPEAASIVFQDLRCPLKLVPYEACCDNGLSWDWTDNVWLPQFKSSSSASVAFLMEHMYSHQRSLQNKRDHVTSFRSCDLTAALVAFHPKVVAKSLVLRAQIETAGRLTRGQLVLDWFEKAPDKGRIVEIVTELVPECVHNVLLRMTLL